MSGALASHVFSFVPGPSADSVSLAPVWKQNGGTSIEPGGSAAVVLSLGARDVLLVYDRAGEKVGAYHLTDGAPWVAPVDSAITLTGGPWDQLESFVLGNATYLLTYRADKGVFGIFEINSDLHASPPYTFAFPRNWPTPGFTTVKPFSQFGNQYVLGYGTSDGKVGIYGITTTTASQGGIPALVGQNVWYHTWAAGGQRFAFFQLGGVTFFFKINVKKLNVNIDHVNDNPATGTVEVGSLLQDKLPDAAALDIAAIVPWRRDEPYLLTYVREKGAADLYRIHADCQGWTKVGSATAPGASLVVPYRVGGGSFALFYGG